MVLSIAGCGKKSEKKKPEENIKTEQSTNNSEVEKENFEKKTGGTYEMTEHSLLSELYKENKVSDICADQTYPGYVYVLTNDGKLYYTKAN